VYGSAVCVYNLTAVDAAFDGPFKYREDSRSAWTRVSNSAPLKVSNYSTRDETLMITHNCDLLTTCY